MNSLFSQSITIAILILCIHSSAFTQGFTDITDQTGITFQHTDGSAGKYWIVESVASGMGVFDYDNDGDLDIYFLNGAVLPGTSFESNPTNRLYRNDGNMKFTDVTAESGTGNTGYGLGCAMADYDHDGYIDIYITNMNEDVLLRNIGDGTFSDVTKKSGISNPKLAGGACFGDYNGDGWLDLFVANYVTCPFDQHKECSQQGYSLYCDPAKTDEYKPQTSVLYFNNGDGTFRDVSEESGISSVEGRGMGVISNDFDNDGDLDIYVANDVMENFLFVNDGKGVFEESALFAGAAFDMHGREQGSMGVDFGDFDNDGNFDLILTNFQNQYNTLYRNEGDGVYKDISITSGFSVGSMPMVSWACFFMDYDNDLDQDVFIGNGHLQDNIEKVDTATKYLQPNQFYTNNADGSFSDVSNDLGFTNHTPASVRGGAYGDLDNDGDLDIVLSNWRDKPTILRNDITNENHWINITLSDPDGIPNGIGARVSISDGGITQMNEVRAGGSYQSQYDTRLHFGLGKHNTIEKVTVRWQDGHTDTFKNVEANRFIQIGKKNSEIKTIR